MCSHTLKIILLTITLSLTACAETESLPPPAAQPTAQPTIVVATATPSPTLTPVPPTLTPTPPNYTIYFSEGSDPFAGITIDALSKRTYGGDGIRLGTVVDTFRGYTQYTMRYPSDGLTITGLVNIPEGEGPYPVALCLHGYIRPEEYWAGFDSARMCNWLAEQGYIGIMPDYRNYGDSDTGPNPFRIGYAIDILNLVEQTDSLPTAAPGQVGIIGHSLGGEIAMWPMVMSDEVDAIVLYASMSGDAARNWRHRHKYWSFQRDAMNAAAALYGHPNDKPEDYARISPINYLEHVRMPVEIHHGTSDESIPFWWASDLAERLEEANKPVTLYGYSGERHGFTDAGFNWMMLKTLALFDAHVREDTNH